MKEQTVSIRTVRIEIQAGNDTAGWQTIHTETIATDQDDSEIANLVGSNQNIADGDEWRVVVGDVTGTHNHEEHAMRRIINLTAHTANLHLSDGSVMDIESSGIARVIFDQDDEITTLVLGDGSISIMATATSPEVTGLPDPQDDVLYLVSRMVYDACPDRSDLVIPHMGIKGPTGQPIGCRALAQPRR